MYNLCAWIFCAAWLSRRNKRGIHPKCNGTASLPCGGAVPLSVTEGRSLLVLVVVCLPLRYALHVLYVL